MKDDKINNPAEKILSLESILDLTVFDIFILFYLLLFSGGSVRFAVLQDLNEYFKKSSKSLPIGSKFRKQLSPSSFYNILKKLEKKGLISTNDKGGNTRTIEPTPFARQALKLISLFTLA